MVDDAIVDESVLFKLLSLSMEASGGRCGVPSEEEFADMELPAMLGFRLDGALSMVTLSEGVGMPR